MPPFFLAPRPVDEEDETAQLALALELSLRLQGSRAVARGRAASGAATSVLAPTTAPSGQAPRQARLVREQPAYDTWDLVEADPEPSTSLQEATAARLHPASLRTVPAGCRYYAVWRIPGLRRIQGVVAVVGPDPWLSFRDLLPEQRYDASRGTRIRRGDSLRHAVEVYRLEAQRHGCRSSVTFYVL